MLLVQVVGMYVFPFRDNNYDNLDIISQDIFDVNAAQLPAPRLVRSIMEIYLHNDIARDSVGLNGIYSGRYVIII